MPKRMLEGKVVGDKMEKTLVVEVNRRVKHPLYKKYITKSKRYLAHNEGANIKIGDFVKIVETKPVSKRKSWLILNKKGAF